MVDERYISGRPSNPIDTMHDVPPPATDCDDIRATLTERGSRYGDFTDHARVAQGIQAVMHAEIGWSELSDVQRQGLTVIADKIARMLTGDPRYLDSVRDIIGYATLMLDRMTVEGATDTKTVQVTFEGGEWIEQR